MQHVNMLHLFNVKIINCFDSELINAVLHDQLISEMMQ